MTDAPPRGGPLVGRADQLTRLDETLLRAGKGESAVALLSGTAGVGKTALAVHWAHQVRDRFPDGQLYVNLRGWAAVPPLRPVEALAGFLLALRVPVEQIPVDVQQAAALYRSLLAGRRTPDAGGAGQRPRRRAGPTAAAR